MQFYFLYIDPGSGSYLVQALIAALLGVVFFFRNIVAAIKFYFLRIFRNKSKMR